MALARYSLYDLDIAQLDDEIKTEINNFLVSDLKDDVTKIQVMYEFCHNVAPGVDCEADFNASVANAVVTYLRSHDYTNDAGDGISKLLEEKIACANDPDCGPGAPKSVPEWIEKNYVDHMNDNSDTSDIRGAYYSALAKDIAHMTAYTIPEELLATYTGTPLETVKTQDWKDDAYEYLLTSFDDFDMEDFVRDANQAQIKAVLEHFDTLTNNDGDAGDSDQDPSVTN